MSGCWETLGGNKNSRIRKDWLCVTGGKGSEVYSEPSTDLISPMLENRTKVVWLFCRNVSPQATCKQAWLPPRSCLAPVRKRCQSGCVAKFPFSGLHELVAGLGGSQSSDREQSRQRNNKLTRRTPCPSLRKRNNHITRQPYPKMRILLSVPHNSRIER